ncbi:MAG: 5'-nucleotidase [Bacteroidota bacterium]
MKHRLFFAIGATLTLAACQTYYAPTEAKSENLRISTSEPAPATRSLAQIHPLDELIIPYRQSLDERMNTVIGEAGTRLYKEKPESPLGNWMADAIQRQVSKLAIPAVDVSIQNYGGIRIPEISEGEITVGKIFELMPFDNMVVIQEMSGLMVQRFFDHMAADGGWPVSSSARFIIQEGTAQQLTIGGEAIQTDRSYRVALPDYIANGGGDCDFLSDLAQENTGILVRDMLIDEVVDQAAAGSPIIGKMDGRISWKE